MNINQITIDAKLNPRHEGLDLVIVAEYAEALQKGDIFPPIEVFSDNNFYWVVDGFHRLEAAKQVGLTEIAANIHVGSWRDAKLFSFGVNAEHGKRRTNADKRKAVTEMLGVAEWASWSDREIARRCKVSDFLVRTIRDETLTAISRSENERTYVTKHGTVSTMQTANIGKKLETEPAEPEPSPKTEKIKSNYTIPPRNEEQQEEDRLHNERVVSRMVRLAGIVKYMEQTPPELITFIYRDMAKLYHPDKQHGEKTEVAQKRAEAFALIADIRQILEVSDAEYRKLAKSKGIIETESQRSN